MRQLQQHQVAPVRERGLKSLLVAFLVIGLRRSRKGAWIEMFGVTTILGSAGCRSRKGAWIEIASDSVTPQANLVAPVRERGLKYHKIHA